MKSPVAYVGGKSRLAETIIERIPPHKTYCEVCCGAGWVFFRKEPSKYEVINDLDSDLITFYRVLQNHIEEFLKQFKWVLSSREWFEDWKRQQAAGGLTDIQRAARYYYLQRHAFGGQVKTRNFGVSVHSAPKINLVRIEEELSAVYLRLQGVVIENLTWQLFIKQYDRAGVFFYLDPPYWEAPHYKHNILTLDEYREMALVLKSLKGDFLLSINDHPDVRGIFEHNGFQLDPVSLTYCCGKSNYVKAAELLISK